MLGSREGVSEGFNCKCGAGEREGSGKVSLRRSHLRKGV